MSTRRYSRRAASLLAALCALSVSVSWAHGPTRQKATETIEINAPAAKIRSTIKDFGNAHAWLLMVENTAIEEIDLLDVGEYPEGIYTHLNDKHVYVANWFSNNISVIDAVTGVVIETIETGDGPRAYGNFITSQ